MDNQELGKIVGEAVATGQPVIAEDLERVFTDQEIVAAARRRDLIGTAATEHAMQPEEIETTAKTPDIHEQIDKQRPSTYKGYNDTLASLNKGRKEKHKLVEIDEETLADEIELALTEEKAAYMREAMEKDPELFFTAVATPNVEVSKKEVSKVAKAFGDGQPYPTYTDEALLNKYSDEQISGTDPGNGRPVIVSFVPSKLTPEMSGTVNQQKETLLAMQAKHPFARVTSHLEDVTYWQTLRAAGHDLTGSGTFELTYSRKFNLPPVRFGGWQGVPGSCVYVGGLPLFHFSLAEYESDGRVVAG